MKKGYLILKDGTIFEGELLGYEKETEGEVVFTTGMVGYSESLTDPSYFGQILTFTYPLIGNYGIFGKEGFESKKIWARGVVTSEICRYPSHQNSKLSINQWCFKNKIPILTGIDTRALTEKLRNHGTLPGAIFLKRKKGVHFEDINKENLVEFVSEPEVKIYSPPSYGKTVLLYDCGTKLSILKALLKRGVRVIKVPWNQNFKKLKMKFSGAVISNGPGDPQKARLTIKRAKELLKLNIPILGICLGHQILALALGAKTFKLKFGHRSQNQPVIDLKTQKCYITSQNHGFAVDVKSLPSGLKIWFKNLNDSTCEGMYHLKYPVWGVQFHPEANPGPSDTEWIFDLFLNYLKKKQ